MESDSIDLPPLNFSKIQKPKKNPKKLTKKNNLNDDDEFIAVIENEDNQNHQNPDLVSPLWMSDGVGLDLGIEHTDLGKQLRVSMRCYRKLKREKLDWSQKFLDYSSKHMETMQHFISRMKKNKTLHKDVPTELTLVPLSLNFLRLNHPFRRYLINLVLNKWFDYFIMAVIMVNVFFLSLDDPLAPDSDNLQGLIAWINYVIVIVFLIEMLMKILAMGLIMGENTYLRSGWNVVDFIINVVGVVGLIPGIARLNAFRTFRVLRLLSISKKLYGLRILVNALLSSLKGIANVGLLMIFLFTIFGIFATQIWMGLFSQQCSTPVRGYNLNDTFVPLPPDIPDNSTEYLGYNITQSYVLNTTDIRLCTLESGLHRCALGDVCTIGNPNPENGLQNFDNIGWTLLTLFTVMSLSGWANVMYNTQDASTPWAWLYFVGFVVFCTMFGMQLMQAVIAVKFDEAADEHKKIRKEMRKTKKKLQLEYLNSQTEIPTLDGTISPKSPLRSTHRPEKKPRSSFAMAINKLVIHKYFEYVLTVIIILNLVSLSLTFYGMSEELQDGLEISNYVFISIFIVEMLLKMIGLGFFEYFEDNFNKFDCFIVISSIVEIILVKTISVKSGLIVLRTLRLFRVFKLVRSWYGLQRILKTVLRSLTSLLYLTLLMGIFILMFALAGRQLFAGKMIVDGEVPRENFDTLGRACLVVFQVITGDDWTTVLYTLMDYSPYSAIFTCVIFTIGQYVLVSLFIGVLLSKFEDSVPELQLAKNEETGETVLVEVLDSDDESDSKSSLYESETELGLRDLIYDRKENDDIPDLKHYQKDKSKKKKLAIKKKLSENVKVKFDDKTGRTKVTKPPHLPEIPDNKSLFIFTKDNKFRLFLWKVINFRLRLPQLCDLRNDEDADASPKKRYFHVFESIVVCVIIANIVLLVVEYSSDFVDDEMHRDFGIVEYFFASFYILEMVIKVIASGFIVGEKSYVKNKWNLIDFLVVILSILSLILPDIRFLKALRSIRILQLLSRFTETRIVVKAIGQAIPAIKDVFVVICLIWYIFAVVGVNAFGGQFWYCTDPNATGLADCVGYYDDPELGNVTRQWVNQPFNFDNVGIALLTLFQIGTLAGWINIAEYAQDINGVDNQPIVYNNEFNALFFVLFVIVGAFFSLNLFTSMVIHHFKQMKRMENGSAWLTPKQRKWIQAQTIIHLIYPTTSIKPPYTGKFKFLNYLFNFVTNKKFDIVISLCIIMNTVVLAIPYYGMDDYIGNILDSLNIFFLSVFAFEAFLKVLGIGPRQYFGPEEKYFKLTWNKFDFVLVIGSLAGLLAGGNVIAINVARLFRMARVIRLIQKLDGLKLIFTTFIRSVPFIMNIMTIVLTVYFIYGIVGVSLFRDLTFSYEPSGINDWANFRDLPTALITLFRISTFDDWTYLAQDIAGYFCIPGPGIVCGSSWAMLYFISFLLLQTYMILNLLLAVLIENFTDRAIDQKVTRLDEFQRLRKGWNIFDRDATGFIKVTNLTELLINLGTPLGFNGNILQSEIIEEYSKMKICLYNENQINFFDLLRGITRRSLKLDLTSITHFEVPKTQGNSVADYYRDKVAYFQNLTDIEKAELTDELKDIYKSDKFFDQYISPHADIDKPRILEERVFDSQDISIDIEDNDIDNENEIANPILSQNIDSTLHSFKRSPPPQPQLPEVSDASENARSADSNSSGEKRSGKKKKDKAMKHLKNYQRENTIEPEAPSMYENNRDPARAAIILALRDTDKERRRNRKSLGNILKKKINIYNQGLKHYEREARKN